MQNHKVKFTEGRRISAYSFLDIGIYRDIYVYIKCYSL